MRKLKIIPFYLALALTWPFLLTMGAAGQNAEDLLSTPGSSVPRGLPVSRPLSPASSTASEASDSIETAKKREPIVLLSKYGPTRGYKDESALINAMSNQPQAFNEYSQHVDFLTQGGTVADWKVVSDPSDGPTLTIVMLVQTTSRVTYRIPRRPL